jgi:hypothetical protein
MVILPIADGDGGCRCRRRYRRRRQSLLDEPDEPDELVELDDGDEPEELEPDELPAVVDSFVDEPELAPSDEDEPPSDDDELDGEAVRDDDPRLSVL